MGEEKIRKRDGRRCRGEKRGGGGIQGYRRKLSSTGRQKNNQRAERERRGNGEN